MTAARRLFFALWPDAAMREALWTATRAAVGAAKGGRAVPRENLHVTLAFLGTVPESSLGAVRDLAREAAAPPQAAPPLADPIGIVPVTFDALDHWRRSQILCATASRPSDAAVALADRLRGALGAGGFHPDLKSSESVGIDMIRPFRPHVTLARKVHRPPRIVEMKRITWSFTDFVLVESKTLPEESVYTVLDKFPVDP